MEHQMLIDERKTMECLRGSNPFRRTINT